MLRNRFILSVIMCLLVFTSCSKYSKLLKGTDYEAKYKAALEYYEKKNYDRALQLFDVMQSYYRTKPEGETISYLTAECYYLISPKTSLDQSDTYTAIKEFQTFADVFPQSPRVAEANARIDTLRVKLEEKEYDICKLYFKMEEYQAAITSYETFLKDHPTTEHREEILSDMVVNYYRYAENSVRAKQRERYELALEKYNTLCYVYPESEYIPKLEGTVKKIREKLEKYKSN